MSDWFTIEKVDDDTFTISEYKHWEEPHCYLLCGQQRAALIDTGLGVSNVKEIVDRLTTLPVVVVTTHAHWDHIGGHKYFEDIAIHECEEKWLKEFPLPLSTIKQNLFRQPCIFPNGFDVDNYCVFQGHANIILKDRDILDLGGRQLMVVHTPGHSPGHCCFYEPERKYLFSGDLIYSGCLDAFYPTTDPVQFSQSVKKVKQLDVMKIFPGHHKLQISSGIIDEIDRAFELLDRSGQLRQGAGLFQFDRFEIRL